MVKEYKIGILQKLAGMIRQREAQERQDDELDAELFSTFLPDPVSPRSEDDAASSALERRAKKRVISEVTEVAPIPKARVPELACVDEVFADGSDEISTRKKVLLTREKLRAG